MVSEIIYMKYHNLVIHLVVFFVISNKLQHSCHYVHNKSEEILLTRYWSIALSFRTPRVEELWK